MLFLHFSPGDSRFSHLKKLGESRGLRCALLHLGPWPAVKGGRCGCACPVARRAVPLRAGCVHTALRGFARPTFCPLEMEKGQKAKREGSTVAKRLWRARSAA